MSRKMRSNSNQWKVLLSTGVRPLGHPEWSSDDRSSCISRGVRSFDEALRCVFAHFDGTDMRIAYVLEPDGFPAAASIRFEDLIRVWRLTEPLRDAHDPFSEGMWESMAFEAMVYDYTRSRGGWAADEGRPAERPVCCEIGMSEHSTREWPYVPLNMSIDYVDEQEGPLDHWTWLAHERARSAFRFRYEWALGERIEE